MGTTYGWLTWLGIVGPLAAGAVLVHLGLRGRRIDDHPLCRRCGFDLFGLPPTSKHCSECGADLARRKAVRVGHRRRRGGLLGAGVLLLLPALIGISIVATAWWGAFDVNTLKPVWLLAREMGSANAATRAVAVREMNARMNVGTLTAQQAAGIADRILAWQQDGGREWVTEWGKMFVTMHGRGLIPDEKWKQFAFNAHTLKVDLRPVLRRGDQLPYAISVVPGRGSDVVRLHCAWELTGHAVGGKRMPSQPIRSYDGPPGYPIVRPKPTIAFPSDDLAAIPDGATTLSLDVCLELRDFGRRRRPTLVAERSVTINAPLELLPQDGPGLELVTDPAVRDAVRAAIGVVRSGSMRVPGPWDVQIRADGRVYVRIAARAPPVDVAYEALLRTEHGEWSLGTILFRVAERSYRDLLVDLPALRDVKVSNAAIVLRPTPAAARETLDVVRICGGSDIAFRDLIVHHAEVTAPRPSRRSLFPPVRPRAPATTRARRAAD